MLRFKDYSKANRTKEGYIILDEPIHFKNGMATYRKDKDGHVIIDEPIHFKGGKKEVKEDTSAHVDHVRAAVAHNEKHGSVDEFSEKLHHATAKDLDHEESEHIKKYTGDDDDDWTKTGSHDLNHRLIRDHELRHHQKEMHNTIMKHAKASGHEFHLFSGTGHDFSQSAKHSKDGVFHSPAHISATHSIHVARHFADNKFVEGDNDRRHMIHIHVKPHDKVLHTSHHSAYSTESETIVPAGTKLKYHHSSVHEHDGFKYHTHHFTIHSQD